MEIPPQSFKPVAILACDPGAKGAIALCCGNTLRVFEMPMRLERRGDSKKPTTDLTALRDLFEMISDVYTIKRAYVEKVWGVRGQGASAGAALGHQRCALEAACVWSGIPYDLVSPQRWKGDLRLFGKDKAAALEAARAAFPLHAELFKPLRKMRDKEQAIGNADAALIAHWARAHSEHARAAHH